MKKETATSKWARRYQTALHKCLKPGAAESGRPAQELGREAVSLGLQTLDVAKAHEGALTARTSSGGISRISQSRIKRAKRFFAEAIVPIEKTHSAAMKDDDQVQQLTRTLRRRTVESSASTRQLKQSIIQRQGAEMSLRKSGQHHAELVVRSHRLQKHLRHLTHKILSAQEVERRKNSRQLHDEIAQTLIAIDLRLLTLKKAASSTTTRLKKEIADTQQLVRKSTHKLNRLLRL